MTKGERRREKQARRLRRKPQRDRRKAAARRAENERARAAMMAARGDLPAPGQHATALFPKPSGGASTPGGAP